MKREYMISVAVFTLMACGIYAFLNPVLLDDLDSEFVRGEVFTPENGSYDFRVFSIDSAETRNFTVKTVRSGHAVLVDDSGNRTINILDWDRMTKTRRDSSKAFIDKEILKEHWTVDGVDVYEIEFLASDNLYSACVKDTSTGRLVYLSTPSDRETADMINSLRFYG